MMVRLPVALLAVALCARPVISAAQSPALGFGRVDPLVWSGQISRADSLLFAASSRAPRDPVTRATLGRWLLARGAIKPGTVLLEEARYFGGDAAVLARALAPAYARAGEYRALVGLQSSPLSAGERKRAESLLNAPPSSTIGDSTTVALVATEGEGLGAVVLRVGDVSLTARIDARARGLVLDTAWRSRAGVEAFPEPTSRPIAGVARRAAIGGLVLTRTPVQFEPTGSAVDARLGLDVLAPYRPTFNAKEGVLVLRRPVSMREARSLGVAWPLLETSAGWMVVPPRDSLRLLGSAKARAAFGGRAWTLEAARGSVTVVYAREPLSRQ
ncbi:MAG: hypothetical protein SFW08_12270 [Gemmatimonadaceae bacterium]|nr:hypothetical protein [Gemmatimonadaceae bacterium]